MTCETWFDSHCHLDMAEFDQDRADRWRAAQESGVMAALIPGLEPSQWQRARLCAAGLGTLSFSTIGLHPWWIAQQPADFTPHALTDALALNYSSVGCLAIGECGLDGAIELPLEDQLPWLDCQLAFAREKSLPVILHQHKAHNPLLQALNRHPGLVGVLHGFRGSLAMAEDYIKRGLLLGIGGVVAEKLESSPRWMGKMLTYQWAILHTFFRYRHKEIEVKSDSFQYSGKIMALVLANGQFFGSGLCIAPDAKLEDGQFSRAGDAGYGGAGTRNGR